MFHFQNHIGTSEIIFFDLCSLLDERLYLIQFGVSFLDVLDSLTNLFFLLGPMFEGFRKL